ncbi:hypothetical protein Vadar_016320 [Vaccinium darrowii]|uniref:Uncharacterized protein n=1 Tax=Vaccinium darrowii TaxID=229202 RepID=A0ACB7Y039_9ERIC|nr:hypothetical protein Vadar_016320 [Vaccinium darrowii]
MSLMGDLFTVFADNLPQDMDAGWLRQIFSSFGRVVDVFIPLKRSLGFKTKFGFIRFKKKEEATCAIDALDGLLIRNFRILVQFAKYPKSTPSTVKSFQKIQVGDHNGNLFDHRWIPKSGVDHPKQSTSGPPSYADILRGGSKVTRPKLVGGIETDVDWLRKSAVGRLINYCDVNKLQDLLISNSIWDAHVRSIGGLNVLISFDSVELLNSFLLDKDNLLPKWFSTVEAWNNQTIKASRCVWISCYGVPLKAWCSSTFIEIGKLWGAVISLDEMTENLFAFDKGRMLLLTDFLDCINEVVDVVINGATYPVKVVEDPMAETSLENRVFSSVKIKKGNSNDGKEGIIQIDPGDDTPDDFDVHEVQDEGIGGELKADMLDVELAFKQDNFVEEDEFYVDPTRTVPGTNLIEDGQHESFNPDEEKSIFSPGLDSLVEDSEGPIQEVIQEYVSDNNESISNSSLSLDSFVQESVSPVQGESEQSATGTEAQSIESNEDERPELIMRQQEIERDILLTDGPFLLELNCHFRPSQLEGIDLHVQLFPSNGEILGRSKRIEDGTSGSEDQIDDSADNQDVEGYVSDTPDQEERIIVKELKDTTSVGTTLGIDFDEMDVRRMKKVIEEEFYNSTLLHRNNRFAPLRRKKYCK